MWWLEEAILSFAMSGTPVNLEGIGRLRPTISRGGVLRLRWLPDRRLALAMANLAVFAGTIANRGSVRMDDAAYKALWDASFPEDPLVTRDGGSASGGAESAAPGEPAARPGDPQVGTGEGPDRSDE